MQPPQLAQPQSQAAAPPRPLLQQQPPQANGVAVLGNGGGPKPRGRRKKVRTEPIRPICPQCEKQFSNQSALTKHKLTHSDERKFACPQCSKAFKRHDHLTGHMQTHSNRKPFTCNIQGCDKTYCDARSLRRHKENIHHIVAPRDNNNNNNNNTNSSNANHNLTDIHNNYLHHHHHHHTHHNHNNHHHHTHHPQHTHHHHMQHLNATSNKLTSNQHEITHIGTGEDNNNIDHDMNSTLTLLSNGTEQTITKKDINQSTPQTPTYQVDNTVTSSTLPSNNTASTEQQQPPIAQQLIQSPTIYSTSPNTVANTNNNTTDGNNNTMNYCNLNNTTAAGNNDLPSQPQQQQQQPTSQQPTHQTPPHQPLSLQHHEPSHLLRRRIQRLHSDQSGTYSCNVDQLACFTVPPHSLGPPPPLTQPNGNSNSSHLQHHNHHNQYLTNQNNHNNNHHHIHASFSADYASTQHFNFDFTHVNTHHGGSHHHLNNQDHHLGHLHTGPLEHTLSTGSVPHSADSVTDSGLGLNMHYEQHTAQPLPLPPPRYNQQLSHQQQQHHHQQAANAAAQQNHISYSAGYAATQHFDFDINNIQSNNSSAHHHQQQAPASAQPAQHSTSTFDFAPLNTNQQQSHHQQQQQPSLEHTLSTGTLSAPHSADSVTDSGLSLNVHYEQHTPQPLGPPSYHQQHQVSYSAGYATTQRFDFDFNNNSTLQARGIES